MSEQVYKHLTFHLDEERYAIPITKIKEIINMLPITHVPRMPDYIKGVINLRGKIVPVIDLRLKFGLPPLAYNDRTSIIVMELEDENGLRITGMVVDAVSEVLDIHEGQISQPPQYGEGIDQSFLMGMGMVHDDVYMLLNVDKALSVQELALANDVREVAS